MQQLLPVCLQQPERGSRSSTCCSSASGCFPNQGFPPFTVCSWHGWSVGLLGLSWSRRAATPRADPTLGQTGRITFWWQQISLGSGRQLNISPLGLIPTAGTLLSCNQDW